jgi:hypothetical protein
MDGNGFLRQCYRPDRGDGAVADIPGNDIHLANFDNFPVVQSSATFNRTPVTSPGQWTLDSALPVENINTYTPFPGDENLSWAWGISTQSDSIDLSPGFRHRVRGGRILYNPPARSGGYGDMDITWKLGTSKTGQGFGSATTSLRGLDVIWN